MTSPVKRALFRYRQAIAIVVLNVLLALYSIAASRAIDDSSTSVEVATFLTIGWVALVGILSFLEASIVSKLVYRGGWRGRQEIRDVRTSKNRTWRDMHLPLSIAIVALLGLNMLVFDRLAGGFFVDEQEANYVITRIRSDDPVLQREGILTATRMGDSRIRAELTKLLTQPGTSRALAAWALGKIGGTREARALVSLLREGDRPEKAAAAVALGRLEHEQLTSEVAARLRNADEPVEAYLVGLGMLGDRHATLPIVEMMIDETTAPDHLALGAWALGRFDDVRACPLLGRIVGPYANPLTCAATTSLRRLRCDQVGSQLMQAFTESERTARCDAQNFVDTNGRALKLWPSMLYRVALLEALETISDASLEPWLNQLSRDGTQVPQVREMVRRILARRRSDRIP